jgi:hypothetical protein
MQAAQQLQHAEGNLIAEDGNAGGILSPNELDNREFPNNQATASFEDLNFPNLTLVEELLKFQINLQKLWVLSHTLTLLGTLLYVFAFLTSRERLQKNSYEVSILSSLFTYLIVLYQGSFEEEVQFDDNQVKVIVKRNIFSLSDSVKNENAQLLGYILLWNVTQRSTLKLVPFFIYSSLNITNYFLLDLFSETAFSHAISPFLNYCEIPLLKIASFIDLLVFGVVGKETNISQNRYPLVIYTLIWLLRFENSEASRTSICMIVRFFDNLVYEKEIFPESVNEPWKSFRDYYHVYFPSKCDLSINDELDDCSTITS